MRYDFLATPVSEAEPTGPDLDQAFDPDYANVTANASSLIPQRFYDRSKDKIFDRSTIELPPHQEAISKLLEQSRDIRLLVLDARLQILAGKLVGFSEALQGLVMVVTTFWDQYHPQPLDGDMIERQNTLEGLDDLAVLVPAIQSAPVLEGRARISYRNYLVAFGTVEPWPAEEPVNRDTLDRSLREEQSKPQLEAAHAATVASQDALITLRSTFIDKAGHVNAPAFDKLEEVLKGLRSFLEDYLGITDAAAEAAAAALAAGEGDASGEGGAARPAGPVTSHAAAVAALKTAEDYFVRKEPSSPAMILIHQARLLVGRPLVEALEALLPEPSARAILRFDSGFRFDLDITRMKLVTDDMIASLSGASDGSDSGSYASDSSAEEEPAAEEDPAPESDDGSEASEEATEETPPDEGATAPPPGVLAHHAPMTTFETNGVPTFAVASRQEASLLLIAVENFFKVAEPSSPVTLLLARARAYIGKDFAAILNELLPPLPPSE